jgi:hypothetical protein
MTPTSLHLLVAGFVALVMMRLLFRRPINATRAAI